MGGHELMMYDRGRHAFGDLPASIKVKAQGRLFDCLYREAVVGLRLTSVSDAPLGIRYVVLVLVQTSSP